MIDRNRNQRDTPPRSPELDDPTTAVKFTASAPTVIGDYTIIREIGRGGMGTVYETEQTSLRRKVALKVLPSHLSISDDAIQKFRREAEAGGRQHHPGIVTVYSVGEEDGVHFIAQELVEEGSTLADSIDVLRSEGAPSADYYREAARLIAEVSDALQHAHDSGVIHRDVKPSNILLTSEGQPKLTDFGLAKVEDALALSRSGEFSGTPYYMSPEQTRSRQGGVDHRTDVFSLGVTLYEMITFERPFKGDTSHEVFKNILHRDPLDPGRVNPAVPRDLAVICLAAMEKDPDARFETMKELGDDLRRFLAGETIQARPAGPILKAVKWVKRHRTVNIAAALLLVSVVALTVLFNLYLEEKRKAASLSRTLRDLRTATEQDIFDLDAVRQSFETVLDLVPSAQGAPTEGAEIEEILSLASNGIDIAFPHDLESGAILYNTIGVTYQRLGRFEEAESHLERALQSRRQCLSEDHPDTLASMGSLATTVELGGNLDKAQRIYGNLFEIRRRKQGNADPRTLRAMNGLTRVMVRRGRAPEARVILEDGLRTAIEGGARERFPTGEIERSHLVYAECLLALDRFQDAESHLLRCYEAFETAKGLGAEETCEAIRLLIRLYDRWPRPKNAKEWRRQIIIATQPPGEPRPATEE